MSVLFGKIVIVPVYETRSRSFRLFPTGSRAPRELYMGISLIVSHTRINQEIAIGAALKGESDEQRQRRRSPGCRRRPGARAPVVLAPTRRTQVYIRAFPWWSLDDFDKTPVQSLFRPADT